MSLAAADSVAPLAVLVLAWDEATPAVRALLEATQAAEASGDSLLLLVPHASEPVPPSAAAPPPAEPAAAVVTEPLPLAKPVAVELLGAELVAAATEPVAPASPVALPAAATLAPLASPSPPARSAAPASPTTPSQPLAPQKAAVRVLHLSALPLPELAARAGQPLPVPTWMGPSAAPAAPYLGASPPLASLSVPASAAADVAMAALPALPTEELVAVPPALPTYVPAEEPAQAPDVAAEALPALADQPTLAVASLPLDEAAPTAELSPAQAGWPEALAALQHPVALPEPASASAPPTVAVPEPVPTALRSATQHFAVPNLNFQVIQYARFAVPLALAEAPFGVVYAPAWPTWLAAQELRVRNKQPLVLHVASLAAAAGESLETAAGWVAELQRQALRRADLVLTETAALAQRIQHELGLAPASVRPVPAADASAIAQALRTAQLRPPAGDVTFAGHDGL